ncbi:MAG TPA: DUF1175 family protein [Pyrinomonadaceae bacterium]|nr:DUF1175 family protein [Pyrinomonadaceae bacterium]
MTASVLVILLATFIWIFSKSSETRPPARVPSAAPIADSNATTETADSDNDGIPDFAELRTFEDRESFRRWFTAIAEVQFYQLSEQWKREQRDCAGLVRFAMREALRKHDRAWFQRMGPAYEPVARDVRGFNLDANQLGEKIFRADFGAYRDDDQRSGKFSEFADARTLKNFNVEFVSRDRREAQPGDLLFYYQPWVQKYPFHVMIFLGSPRTAPNGQSDWVVYHTGSSATDDDGTVKKVELSVLDQHPDPRWRPIERNKNFLGFYRLKSLQ